MNYLDVEDYIELNKIAVVRENEEYLGAQYLEGLDILKEADIQTRYMSTGEHLNKQSAIIKI